MLLKDFISTSQLKLSPLYEPEEARAVVLSLCSDVLGTTSYTHIIEPGRLIPGSDLQFLENAVVRLSAGEPLQYVLGHAEFYGLDFKVSPAVLIPRPETELMCRILIDGKCPDYGIVSPSVLDLCTGSGCIAWTLAQNLPGSRVTAVDLSEEALAVASSQPFDGNRPQFVRQDVLDTEAFAGSYDLIVSNPPYVRNCEKREMRTNVLDHEPAMALFVEDGDPLLFYRAVARIAVRTLRPGGIGAVEINEAFGPETAAVFSGAGFRDVCLEKDLSGRDRMVFFAR